MISALITSLLVVLWIVGSSLFQGVSLDEDYLYTLSGFSGTALMVLVISTLGPIIARKISPKEYFAPLTFLYPGILFLALTDYMGGLLPVMASICYLFIDLRLWDRTLISGVRVPWYNRVSHALVGSIAVISVAYYGFTVLFWGISRIMTEDPFMFIVLGGAVIGSALVAADSFYRCIVPRTGVVRAWVQLGFAVVLPYVVAFLVEF